MLKKRDRGKEAVMGIKSGETKQKRFGETETGGIEGIELLEHWKAEKKAKQRQEEGDHGHSGGVDDEAETEKNSQSEGDEGEEEGADTDEDDESGWDEQGVESDDDSGGWINMESDAEVDLGSSDDDDDEQSSEKPPLKKSKMPTGEDDGEGSDIVASPDESAANLTKIPSLATTKVCNSLLYRLEP